MHTNEKLARALLEINAPPGMIQRAREGYYHDFMSPLDLPTIALVDDLAKIGPKAQKLRSRVMAGDFDATDDESEEWARSDEGREALGRLARGQ
jgi:hypothetical protein